MMTGLESSVVRGLLTRSSPAPWSIHYVLPDDHDDERDVELEEPRLEVRDATESLIALMTTDPTVGDDASLIAAAPTIAQDYVNALTGLSRVDHELHAAGIEYPLGHRGVRDLAMQRDGERDQADQAQELVHLARSESAQLAETVAVNAAKLSAVRGLMAQWRAREMGEEAFGLYRELVSVLMSSSSPADDNGNEYAGEPSTGHFRYLDEPIELSADADNA